MTTSSPPGARAGALLARARKSILVRNFAVQLANFSSQIVMQFAFLFVITNTLGKAGYGVFSSLTAITVLGGIVTGLGGELLTLKRVAEDHDRLRECVGHALLSAAATAPIVGAACFVIAAPLYSAHMAMWAIGVIVVADIVFTKMFNISTFAFLALDQVASQLFLNFGYAAARVLAIVGASATSETVSLDTLAVWYLGATASWGLFSLGLVSVLRGAPILRLRIRDWPLGFQFMVDQAAQAGFRDLDKPSVVQALGPALGGTYTLAFRLAEAATTPIRALLYAVATRFFKTAAEGPASGVAFGLRVVPVAVAMSAAIAVGIVAVAGLVPYVFRDFPEAAGYVRLLAPYPLLIALTFIGLDILRATDRQHIRVAIILTSAVVTVPVITAGAGAYGVVGALGARLGLQALVVAAAWAFVFLGAGRRPAPVETAGAA